MNKPKRAARPQVASGSRFSEENQAGLSLPVAEHLNFQKRFYLHLIRKSRDLKIFLHIYDPEFAPPT
ncbi:hypothetical protein KP014_05505 [Paenibacillus sophorae]|uniref:Uncharacterized protein n=1 Tax=Paenibacillus sophorae TaxID=1333845 RepID=A0ABX8HES1_9BACL|nr:hypothetical protein [Paenibacillus sophorae]QWU16676.1 hypothetical protein KP014_05505 [Paenibacillus sophorae]